LNHVNNRRNRRRLVWWAFGDTLRVARRPHLWHRRPVYLPALQGEAFAPHEAGAWGMQPGATRSSGRRLNR
jgi:hypothetical protein